LRYEKKTKKVDYYAQYLFKDDGLVLPDIKYERNAGLQLAADIHVTDALSWAVAWQHTDANLVSTLNNDTKKFNSDIIGTSIFYYKDNWMIGAGGGYYKNIAANKVKDIESYLNSESYGVETIARYFFNINKNGLKNISPYIVGSHFEYTHGNNYKRSDLGLAVATRWNYGIGFDIEHYFTSDTIHTPA